MTDIIHSPVTVPTGMAVDTTGTFNAGAAFAIDAAAQVINAAWGLGNTKNADFEAKVAAITAAIQALIDGATLNIAPSSAAAMTITEPTVVIPTAMNLSDITAAFDAETTTLISLLAAKVTAFETEYFPNEQGVYDTAEAWLQAALNNPSGGIPAAVQAQLFTDDRDRVTIEATRASDVVMITFAARRFPAPPGAAFSAALQIQQDAQDSISESSRKLVIQSIEQMRFVIEKAMGLRQMALASAVDYVKLLSIGPDISSRVVGIGYDAQSKLISAVSSYYGARTTAAKAVSEVSQFNAAATQDAAAKNQVAALTLIEDKVKALMTEVQAIAQITTSLFNNVHAAAGTSYTVQV